MADVCLKNKKMMFIGEVVSDKMHKTVVVKLERAFKHSLFHKTVRKIKKYKVHDEKQEARIGDMVEFYEGKPCSKTKYMYLARIVKANAITS